MARTVTHNYRFTVLILICFSLVYFVEAQNDNYYEVCENRIRRELGAFKESDLLDEVRLTRIADVTASSSVFFPYTKILPQNQLFMWNGVTESAEDDLIVIGVLEKSSSWSAYSNVWMSSTFTALRKINETIPTKNPNIVINHFYAMVAYVRHDLSGSGKLRVEWDRWSAKVVRNLFSQDTEAEAAAAAETLNFETLLCLYGSCACSTCDCSKKSENSSKKADASAIGADGAPIEMYADSMEWDPAGSMPDLDEDEEYTLVSSFATSKNRNAYSSAISHSNGETRAAAEAENGTAVAEGITKEGTQSLAASRGKNALSEAEVGSNGDATALSIGKSGGLSQSSAQSRGGGVEAKSVMRGSDKWQPPAGGGMHDADDEISENDPMKLFRDTEKAFDDAGTRAQIAKGIKKTSAAEDLCSKEPIYEDTIAKAEEARFIKKHGKNASTNATTRCNLLDYGIDVDVQVNSTVIVASVLPSFAIQRKACCDVAENDTSAVIMEFLKKIKQECLGGFGSQAARITNSSMDARLQKILKSTKLSKEQHQDLVPLVLLKAFDDKKNFEESKRLITEAFHETVSDEVNFVVSLVVNSAYFAKAQGRIHKVKIWKGLAANLRSVWIGLLLEFKKCKMQTGKCDDDSLEKLKSETRLILGVYTFLKFSDGRWSGNVKPKSSLPVEPFIDFYKQHTMTIAKLAFCKSRRVFLSSQTTAGENRK